MIWANRNNQRIKAIPKQKANCPLCNEGVISKCGNIKIWHWSHKSKFECDDFGEPETPWHLEWKRYFEEDCQEVIIGKHRADIKTKKGLVIEIQNSSISEEQIHEREKFYENMIWILNGATIGKNIEIKYKYKRGKIYVWKWFPKSWDCSKKEIYIDLRNNTLLKIDTYNNYMKRSSIVKIIAKYPFIINYGGIPK